MPRSQAVPGAAQHSAPPRAAQYSQNSPRRCCKGGEKCWGGVLDAWTRGGWGRLREGSAPASQMHGRNGGTLAELMFAQRETQVVWKRMPLLPKTGQAARDVWDKGNNGARPMLSARPALLHPPSTALSPPLALM